MDIEQMKKELAELRAYKEAAEMQEPSHIIDWEFDDDPDDVEARGDLIIHQLNGAEYPAGTPLYAKPVPAEQVPDAIQLLQRDELEELLSEYSFDIGEDYSKAADAILSRYTLEHSHDNK